MSSEQVPTESPSRAKLLRRPLHILKANNRAYLVINVAAYGLTLIGFAVGLAFPDLSAAQAQSLEEDGTGELVRWLFNTPPLFALTILGVNIFHLSLLTIVIPSMVVPFAGLASLAYWVLDTGITLVPATPETWVALIPHSLTLIIELQAYILIVLGMYLHANYWLFPDKFELANRKQGYLKGLRITGLLAIPALVLLVIGAIWEAYSLRYLVHPLGQLLL